MASLIECLHRRELVPSTWAFVIEPRNVPLYEDYCCQRNMYETEMAGRRIPTNQGNALFLINLHSRQQCMYEGAPMVPPISRCLQRWRLSIRADGSVGSMAYINMESRTKVD